MEYKRINFTHSDLMKFQNDILLTDDEKFVILSTQLIEYQSTDPRIFNLMYCIGANVFKFSDAKIRSLEDRVLQEKSHIRQVIFDSTTDKAIHSRYKVWQNKLTDREKYIIWSFCLNEIRNALGKQTIEYFEDQIFSILKMTRKDHIQIHMDINKLNYLCQNFTTLFK